MNGTFMLLSKHVLLLFQCLPCLLLVHPLSASAEAITNYYDAHQRLTGASYDSGIYIGYTYDDVGNRLTETVSATPQNAPAAITPLSEVADLSKTKNDTLVASSLLPKAANTNTGAGGSTSLPDADTQNDSNTDTTGSQDTDAGNDTTASITVYEDAQDGKTHRWGIDSGPEGASIKNIYDTDKGSQVIELSGDALLNGFELLKDDGSHWNDIDHKIIQWSMKSSKDFVVSVAVQTTDGPRYLSFTPDQADVLGNDTDIFYGLGASSKNGKWHTYTIDLGYELHRAQPSTTLVSLLGFYVNGGGLVDDIQTLKTIPADLDSNGDGITDIDEIKAGTNPYRAH